MRFCGREEGGEEGTLAGHQDEDAVVQETQLRGSSLITGMLFRGLLSSYLFR